MIAKDFIGDNDGDDDGDEGYCAAVDAPSAVLPSSPSRAAAAAAAVAADAAAAAGHGNSSHLS